MKVFAIAAASLFALASAAPNPNPGCQPGTYSCTTAPGGGPGWQTCDVNGQWVVSCPFLPPLFIWKEKKGGDRLVHQFTDIICNSSLAAAPPTPSASSTLPARALTVFLPTSSSLKRSASIARLETWGHLDQRSPNLDGMDE